jgi:signal transduction histidine kinase
MTTEKLDPERSLSVECLRFFGAMSASVSHEIKNKLAVINEKAGLVEDIAVAMRSGHAADPDRLETQARKIAEQVREANRIVRALNRLAHSTDEARTTVDATDLAALAVELYRRTAAMAQTAVDSRGPDGEVPLRTNPFLLVNAIGLCLGMAVAKVDESRALTVVTERAEHGAVIRLHRVLAAAIDDAELERACPMLGALLQMLGGRLSVDRERDELVLEIDDQPSKDSGSQR